MNTEDNHPSSAFLPDDSSTEETTYQQLENTIQQVLTTAREVARVAVPHGGNGEDTGTCYTIDFQVLRDMILALQAYANANEDYLQTQVEEDLTVKIV